MEMRESQKGRKGQRGGVLKHGIAFIHRICREYHEGNLSMRQLAGKYNLPGRTVYYWIKKYSAELADKEPIIITPMTEQESNDFEQLKKQNEALRKKLEYEQLKNFSLETMIELAKTELGVDLRKNSGAKQPKE